MGGAAVVRVENLSVAILGQTGGQLAVDAVSFDVRPRETVCIVGESGSGKSMIAHAIIGLLPTTGVRHSGGSIHLGDTEVTALPESEMRKLRGSAVGMIFQEPMSALNPVMTVGRQIEEVLQAHTTMQPAQRQARVVQLLSDVRLPDPHRACLAYPFQLSGGQRQRVMIAMALALEPRLLIADEPTTALDVTTQAQILLLVRELQQRRDIGVLFITHDFGVVADIADRVLVMQRGRCVESGHMQQVLDAPLHPYTKQLMAAVPRLRTTPRKHPMQAVAPSLLKVQGLSKQYRGRGGRLVSALDGVNMALCVGETVGIVGESGSGKSTLGKVIAGLIAQDSGAIEFDGHQLTAGRGRGRQGRQAIQMVFQDPFGSLNPRHRIVDIIASGPIAHGLGRQAAHVRASELLALVELDSASLQRFPHQFSGGQRQRISIARALAMQPRLLIADEAVSALDVSIQAQVLALLRGIQRTMGLSMIFITHDLRVASEICDRIVVMRAGKVVEDGDVATLCSSPEHDYTRQLLAAIPGQAKLGRSRAEALHHPTQMTGDMA